MNKSFHCIRHPIMSRYKHYSLFSNFYILKCNRNFCQLSDDCFPQSSTPPQRFQKWRKKMVSQASPLTNLSPYASHIPRPKFECVHAKRISPGRPSFSSTRHHGAWPGPKNIQILFGRCWCCQPFQRSWTLDLQRLCWGCKLFSENLQTWAFEMAVAVASGPGRQFITEKMEKHKKTFDGDAQSFTGTRR